METSPPRRRVLSWQQLIVLALLISAGYFGMVYAVTTLSYRMNRYFGFFWSVALAMAGVGYLAVLLRFVYESKPEPGTQVKPTLIDFIESHSSWRYTDHQGTVEDWEINFFVPLVSLFTFSWASLAYGCAVLRPSAYSHPEAMSYGLMVKHYLWQFVDLLPFLEVWKTIHLEDPVKEGSLWPGALVVAYRLAMLYLVFSAAATLFGLRKSRAVEE